MAQFNRPPRLISPLPNQIVKMPKIPGLSSKNNSAEWLIIVLPFIAVILSAVIMFAFSGGSSSWTSYLLFIPIMLFSYLASFLVSAKQRKENNQKIAAMHSKLKSEIFSVEKTLSELNKEEQGKRLRNDPDFDECIKRAQEADPRLGERRPADQDFLHVRVGKGIIPSTYQIQQEETNQDSDEFIKEIKSLGEITARYGTITGAPFVINFSKIGALGICGQKNKIRIITNSILCQTMTHHWPDEVRFAVACSPEAFEVWKWLKIPPHSSHIVSAMEACASQKDVNKANISIMKELELELQQRERTYEAKKLLNKDENNELSTIAPLPRLIIVFDEMEPVFNHPAISLMLEKGKDLGVYGIFLTNHSSKVPGGCGAIINSIDNKILYKESGIRTLECVADTVEMNTAKLFTESLSKIQYPTGGISSQPPEQVTFLQMFNAKRVEEISVEEWWNGKSPYGYLCTPIGKTSPTSDWIFDLNDRDGAHGPHGLLGGMTGSGKSETLKTIILSLAVTHHPYDLNFALIDFKGGAAFNELRNLPHTVGVITDIESNATFAERVIQSLTGEIERRKKILENSRGIFGFGRSHIDEYREKLRTRRPLPRLLVVFDEFAEFKTRNPVESRKLIGIARQGRSLGVHLLLATQNISAAIDPEILQNSTYRICLRVSDAQDSIQMIGIPDAISLKRGRAYFSVSNRVLYQSAFSGADYNPDNIRSSTPNSIIRIYPDGKRDVIKMMVYNQPNNDAATLQPVTEAVAVVDFLADTAKRMGLQSPPSIWQEALPNRAYLQDTLDQNLSGGWDGITWQKCHEFNNREKVLNTVYPYLGIYDKPQDQSQPSYQIDPLQGGNFLIFGSAGSGKSTLLRTLVTSLCLTHNPEQVHIFILDFGGQSRLKILESFPHVGAVITRLETERTERLISYLSSEILRRNTLMRKAKVDSWADYNAQAKSKEGFPAIFLLVDNFLNLKDTFEPDVIKKIVMLLCGQSVGIHLAIATYIQSDIPNELLSNINSRISFYQATSDEYHGLVGFPSDACLQEEALLGMRPGRGLLRSTTPLSFQALLPTYGNNDKELTDNLTSLSTAMERAWKGKPIPQEIQALDDFIYMPPVEREKDNYVYHVENGITYQDLKPIGFTLAKDSNTFLISSTSSGDGKTTYLKTWILNIAEKFSSSQIEINIIGYHCQSLLALKTLPHVKYIKFKPSFLEWINKAGKLIEKRKIEQEKQIRTNADGYDQDEFLTNYPHILIVVDDYSKFSSSLSDDERSRLGEIIQNGDEVGVSIAIADTMADLPKVYQDSLMNKFSANGCGVLFGGSDGIDIFNNAHIMPGQPMSNLPTGRGYFIRRGKIILFQAGVWWQQFENPLEVLQSRMDKIINSK